MSLLVGGAALLAVGAAVALVLGWATDDAALAWASVVCSGVAGALLFAASRAAGRDGPPSG
ncbi:MAG: hypothetical protein ABR613_04810 [Actinomycetota bacterium]